MTIQNATDLYGPPIYIVDPTLGSGTHQTISAAITSANLTSNATIFIRPGTYTENPTAITAPMTITAWNGDADNPNVTVIGTFSCSSAVTFTISHIRLQTNSNNILSITGSVATICNLKDCYLNCTNFTGITYSSSSASSQINLIRCKGDLGTTGIAIYTMSSTGTLSIQWCNFTNSGNSVTAASNSAGTVVFDWSTAPHIFSTSSSGVFNANYSKIQPGSLNTAALTTAGTGSSSCHFCEISSGTASAVSIGAGTTFTSFYGNYSSSNTNVITGAGTVQYGALEFSGSSSGINTTTQTAQTVSVGSLKFQPATGTAGASVTNTMTNYEEGTWTPNLFGASTAGTTTYVLQQGYYIKTGSLVTVWGTVQISAATGTGSAQINGLPFTSRNQSAYNPVGTLFLSSNTWAWTNAGTMVTMNFSANSTTFALQSLKSAGGNNTVAMTNAAAIMYFTLSYEAA